jgi:predicted lipoprotein
MFDFGPADEPLGMLSQELGTFPTAPNLIETAIRERNFTTANFQRDTRGFPAMEYLLFSDSTVGASPERVVMRFLGDTVRMSVLRAIMYDVKTKVGNVVTKWRTTYRGTFIVNDGTNVGSSTSLLFNTFVINYEQLKNFKFGVPAGLRAGQTRIEPQRVEGYWSGQSLKYAKEHLTAVENVWAGKSKAGQDFTGFEEYLNNVQGGKELVANTKTQLANTKTALGAIPTATTLAATIEANPTSVQAAFTELQKMTRFFKSDMSSLLGLQITFSSGDGD